VQGLGGSTLAKVLVRGQRPSLKVRATPTREGAASTGRVAEKRGAGSLIPRARGYQGTGLWRPSVHSDVAF